MKFSKTKTKKGLRVITVPIPGLESMTLTVWVGTGSRYENDKIAGLSHFLEHMPFKGTKKWPTPKDMAEVVDAIGAEFNAGTSKHWTNFYIRARKKHLKTAFEILSDMVLNPLLKEEYIEKEKGVILEEMAMYEDTPIAKVGDVFENLIFEGNPLGRDIIGTSDAIKKMHRNDFVAYRDKHYTTNNILITASGAIDEKEVLSLSEKYFGDLKESKKENIAKFVNGNKRPVVIKYKDIEQAHIEIGFYASSMGTKERFAETMLSTILGGGRSSRIFTEVRQNRGLAYAVRTSTERYIDIGYIDTYAGVDITKAKEALEVIVDQLFGIASGKYPIKDEELVIAKEYYKGHFALSLEETENVNGFFGIQEIILGKIDTPYNIYQSIDKVTKEDVKKAAERLIVPDLLRLAIIGPFKDSKKFEKILQS